MVQDALLYAFHVSLAFLFSGIGWIFLLDGAHAYRGDAAGMYLATHVSSMVVVFPVAAALATACFRLFPERMAGRRLRRALFTGSVAALLIWSGLGEALLKVCADAYDAMPGLRAGWIFALVLGTPFMVFLSVAQALGLLIPSGRPRSSPLRVRDGR